MSNCNLGPPLLLYKTVCINYISKYKLDIICLCSTLIHLLWRSCTPNEQYSVYYRTSLWLLQQAVVEPPPTTASQTQDLFAAFEDTSSSSPAPPPPQQPQKVYMVYYSMKLQENLTTGAYWQLATHSLPRTLLTRFCITFQ